MDMDVDSGNLPLLATAPDLTRTGRPRCNYRIPRRFKDFLPESAAIFETEARAGPLQRVILVVRDRLVTVANLFGIWRDYPRRPTRDPDAAIREGDLLHDRYVILRRGKKTVGALTLAGRDFSGRGHESPRSVDRAGAGA